MHLSAPLLSSWFPLCPFPKALKNLSSDTYLGLGLNLHMTMLNFYISNSSPLLKHNLYLIPPPAAPSKYQLQLNFFLNDL